MISFFFSGKSSFSSTGFGNFRSFYVFMGDQLKINSAGFCICCDHLNPNGISKLHAVSASFAFGSHIGFVKNPMAGEISKPHKPLHIKLFQSDKQPKGSDRGNASIKFLSNMRFKKTSLFYVLYFSFRLNGNLFPFTDPAGLFFQSFF